MDISSQSEYALTERIRASREPVQNHLNVKTRGALDNHENRNHVAASMQVRNETVRIREYVRLLSDFCCRARQGSNGEVISQLLSNASEVPLTDPQLTVDEIRTMLVCADKDLFAVQCHLTNLSQESKELVRIDGAQKQVDKIRTTLDIIEKRILKGSRN